MRALSEWALSLQMSSIFILLQSGFQEITADFILQKDVLYDASSFVPFFLRRRVPVSSTKDAKHPWVTQMSFI